LRNIRVHHEIASFAFCHHWTNRPPSLPTFHQKKGDSAIDKQLDFERALASVDEF